MPNPSAVPGRWLGASTALGRPVPTTESYPHVCRRTLTDALSGRPVRLTARDCAACWQQRIPHRLHTTQETTTVPITALPTLAAALALADEGLPVFLLGRSKRPVANCPDCPNAEADPNHNAEACGCLTCHGFYAATTDPARIAAIHAAIPGGLLAIRTGTVADLAVIDIDPRNGGRLDPDLMPPTRCVATGSGGWHLYYRHPGGRLAAKLAGHPGVDIKADGGYVVAPPSIHPGTRQAYRRVGDRAAIEMPPPLITACQPAADPPPAAPARTPTPTTRGRGISSPAALLAAHLDAVARAPKGSRRNVLYGAARGVARMVAAGAITATDAYKALYDAGVRAQQTHRDIRAAITGGFRAEAVTTEGIAA
jgi:Bifunctional DNA primase/polymerase, N-terminal